MKKIILISSSGGHYEQLMMLQSLMENNKVSVVTEKTKYNKKKSNHKYLLQVNRKNKLFIFKMLINTVLSLIYFFLFSPNIIISTGTLCSIPMCLIAKFFGKKVIYIESHAKIITPTKTGQFLYNKVDVFIIQWEELRFYYPKAIYFGGVY